MMDSGSGEGTRALVGPADIARLAGVKRPAVSNWRRRFEDFPRQVEGTASNPLFALEAVREWCREHGRAFEVDRADLLWQRVRAEVPDVRRTEFMAYAGRLLAGLLPAGHRPEGVPEAWADLAGEVLAGDGPEPVFEELCARLVRERGRAETPRSWPGGWRSSPASARGAACSIPRAARAPCWRPRRSAEPCPCSARTATPTCWTSRPPC
ncbi:hypothetical protein HFP72_04910 [Nocardiopsis sp. ARC36]